MFLHAPEYIRWTELKSSSRLGKNHPCPLGSPARERASVAARLVLHDPLKASDDLIERYVEAPSDSKQRAEPAIRRAALRSPIRLNSVPMCSARPSCVKPASRRNSSIACPSAPCADDRGLTRRRGGMSRTAFPAEAHLGDATSGVPIECRRESVSTHSV